MWEGLQFSRECRQFWYSQKALARLRISRWSVYNEFHRMTVIYELTAHDKLQRLGLLHVQSRGSHSAQCVVFRWGTFSLERHREQANVQIMALVNPRMLVEKIHHALKITVWLDSSVPQFILSASPINNTVVHAGWYYTTHSKHLGLTPGHFQSTCTLVMDIDRNGLPVVQT